MPANEGACDGCGAASPAWTLHGGHWWLRDAGGEWRYLDDSRGENDCGHGGSGGGEELPAGNPGTDRGGFHEPENGQSHSRTED